MPTTRRTDVVRFQLQGSLGQGEVFGFGWDVTLPDTVSTQAAFQTFVTAVANALPSALLSLAPFIDANASYSTLKAYGYLPVSTAKGADFIASAPCIQVGSGTANLPLQTCAVATTRSATPTRNGRGRMYIPVTCGTLANHQLTAAQCSSLGAAAKAILNAAKGVNAQAVAVVWSGVRGGQYTILSTSVDSRTDVQRRRAEGESVLFTNVQTL